MASSEKKYPIICQEWVESERGWGIRPDGCSLHLTVADCKRFIKEYWDKMPDEVPDEYSRPSGEPFVVDIDQKTYDEVCTSECGVWH